MSLEEVFQFIEAKEAGKRSAGCLFQSQGVDAAHRQYQRALNRTTSKTARMETTMSCAPIVTSGAPWQECPNQNTTTWLPHLWHHLRQVWAVEPLCKQGKSTRCQKPTPPSGNTRETEIVIFVSLCTTTSLSNKPGKAVISLDHHLYCHLTDHWIRQPSTPQPFIMLTATAHPDDYTALGYNPPHHGWHLYNSPLWLTQAARAAWPA